MNNCLILSVRDRLQTSESDVYRRQILTSKDGPRTHWKVDYIVIEQLRGVFFYVNVTRLRAI